MTITMTKLTQEQHGIPGWVAYPDAPRQVSGMTLLA